MPENLSTIFGYGRYQEDIEGIKRKFSEKIFLIKIILLV
jgi:hypothetical protein